MKTTKRALVLSGGGVTGIAWGIGFLTGLARRGVNLQDPTFQPNLTVGTSAGSVVGALLFQGAALEQLLEAQLIPVDTPDTGPAASFNVAALTKQFTQLVKEVGPDPIKIRRRIGELALSHGQGLETERLAAVAARFPMSAPSWPQQALTIIAVDVHTGDEAFFTKASQVPLVQAVAASCAVPGVWPPVTIGQQRYMDGGARSITNADLASGYERVLILSLSAGHDSNPQIQGERALLEQQGAEVLVIGPDEASVAAIGPNMLATTTRAQTAKAGADQGERLAQQIQTFWQ